MITKKEINKQIEDIEQNLSGVSTELDSLIKNGDYDTLLDSLNDVQNVVSMLIVLKAVVYEA